jgi:RNA polymerase sigma factor (sigma-70 family)
MLVSLQTPIHDPYGIVNSTPPATQCSATVRSGERCRNHALDESGYCAVHHPDPAKRPASGRPFEEGVQGVLRLLGYTVEHDVTVAGCQIDLMATLHAGVISHRLIVDCKDYDRPVGNDEVKEFAGIVAVARNQAVVDKGLMVARSGFTRHAKELAERSGIEAVAFEVLQNQLIDFRPYLERVVTDYESSDVAPWFIDLSYAETEDYASGDIGIVNRPLEDAVNRVLLAQDRSRLALLGNFGTGKSTWCRKYARDLAKTALAKGTGRIPVVVTLSDYDAKLEIQQLIINTLQFEYGVRIDAAICLELQRLGRFLFLLDGFDEMAKRVDADVVRDNLRELEKLSRIPQNKFIVTCRTHFFRDRLHAGVLKDFSILYIPEWGEAELREYLQKRFAGNWERQMERIHGTHNLSELAQTPLFLEMIVETLPKLGEEVKRAELYEKYTSTWIDEQSLRRGARLDAAARLAFVVDLAVRLYRESKLSCHYSEFPKILKARFDLHDAAQMDYLQHDVQSCTFVTRTSTGHYEFRHKSFMEFFVARALREQITAGNQELLSLRPLPVEIRRFVAELLWPAPPREILIGWRDAAPDGTLKDNVVALAIDLQIKTSAARIRDRTEDETILAFLQGDTEAFGTIYARYAAWLTTIVRDRGVPPEIAPELVSDILFQVVTEKERLPSIKLFRKFLTRLAMAKVVDYRRRKQHEDHHVLSLADVTNIRDVSADFMAFDDPRKELESAQVVAAALEKLSSEERTIIEQSVLQGEMLSSVARRNKLTNAEARTLRQQALRKLRSLLATDG